MRARRFALLGAITLLILSGSARAQPIPPAAIRDQGAAPASSELVELFAALCLMKFPDDAAADAYGHAKGFTPMPMERLRSLLGTAPGRGWLYETPLGVYAVTIEKPPYHTCTIRKRFATAPNIHNAYSAMLTLWSTTQRAGTLKELPSQRRSVGGNPTQTYLWALRSSDAKRKEELMALVTSIGQETEIRLVHATGNR